MEFPNKRYEGLHESTVLTGEEFKLLKNYMSCDIFNHIQTGKTEREYDEFMEKNRDPEIEDEFIISLVSRDMEIIKDLLQGIWK